MFDPDTWGTVAAWTGSLLTGLSVLFGVGYYVFDRRRERRAQAGSVVVWLHPHEHGPPIIKMLNLSDKPVFDHGCAFTSKSKRQVAKKERKGWHSGPFDWPEKNKFTYHSGKSFINYHDGSEVYLGQGKTAEYLPELQYHPAVYDFYVFFRDASGEHWVVDARTQRPVSRRRKRRLGVGQID
jgi:hypothetical protein